MDDIDKMSRISDDENPTQKSVMLRCPSLKPEGYIDVQQHPAVTNLFLLLNPSSHLPYLSNHHNAYMNTLHHIDAILTLFRV
jgi:hypothetical protein